MTSKHKSSDAGNSEMPKRSCKVRKKSSIYEIVKKEKEICACFAIVSQTAEVTAMVHAKHVLC